MSMAPVRQDRYEERARLRRSIETDNILGVIAHVAVMSIILWFLIKTFLIKL